MKWIGAGLPPTRDLERHPLGLEGIPHEPQKAKVKNAAEDDAAIMDTLKEDGLNHRPPPTGAWGPLLCS